MTTNNKSIEELKKINEQINLLNQKRTQFMGAVESLKSQKKELEKSAEKDFNLSIDELEKHIETENLSIQKEEKSIIKKFTKLYDNETIQRLITIKPPFTIEMIYKEIQNNLFNHKSKVEAEMNSIDKQQKEIESTLSEEYNLEVANVETEMSNLSSQLSELEVDIQKMYNDILADDELKALIERG